MKVLYISKWAKAPSPEERDAILPKEVPATLKLYLDGVIEQMWFKLDPPGVVFLVNAEVRRRRQDPRAWPADGPSRPDGLRLHPGRAAGSARQADRRKVSVARRRLRRQLARRALILSWLAQVISERKVQGGLRRVVPTKN